jgi:Domain of unknown function (DUF4145)
MFKNDHELIDYVSATYPEVTDQRIDDQHWDLVCTTPVCQAVRGFQIVRREVHGRWSEMYSGHFEEDFFTAPKTYYFRCPVCKAFKVWIVYEISYVDAADKNKMNVRYFRVTSLPAEGIEEIGELPEKPAALRIAYRQAIRAMDANAHIAAAAMFRRALQVITRDLLGAKPGALANELNQVVGKAFNGGVITENFANVGYIVKEVGNQGAHPDRDPDLLDFTPQDAEDLQRIFMELVSELFIIPEATRKAKADFLARRKIEPRPKPA